MDQKINPNVAKASQVFDEYGDYIRAVIRFRVKDESLVEDLYHDFYLNLVNNPIPDDVKNVKSFIYKIIVCDIVDEIRKIQRHKAKLQVYAEYHQSHTAKEMSPKNNSETIEKITQEIKKQLTLTEAKAIDLRFNQNCDVQETAEKMGVKPRSVSRYMSVGLSKLKKVLSD